MACLTAFCDAGHNSFVLGPGGPFGIRVLVPCICGKIVQQQTLNPKPTSQTKNKEEVLAEEYLEPQTRHFLFSPQQKRI